MKSIFSDFNNFWGSLEASQKVSFFFATVLVVGGIVGISLWAQRPDMSLLYGGLNEKDGAAIIQHLESQGIEYDIRYGGSSIFVPRKSVYKARMDIVSSGVVMNDSVGFEIFDKNSFGASDFIQRTNFTRAIQGELARTIMQLQGVRSARVMVVIPESRLLVSNKKAETTASVFVEVGSLQLAGSAVRSIQALVAHSVEGLEASNVTVVDNGGNILSKESRDGSLVAASSAILEYRGSVESYFAGRVESMLEQVLGAGNATVRVHAEIDSEEFSRLEEVFDETAPVLRSSSTEDQVMRSTKPVMGGPVGAAQEGGGVTSALSGETEEESSKRDQEYAIDRTVTNVSRAAGSVKRLTASVFIAAQMSAGAESGAATAQPRSDEEIARIRQIVANALGINLEDAQSGDVEVQEMTFARGSLAAGLATPDIESPLGGFDFVEFGAEITGSVLALILFVVFLIMYRKLKNQPSPFDQMEQVVARLNGSGNRFSQSEITPDLLNQLITQRPNDAAASISSWLQERDES